MSEPAISLARYAERIGYRERAFWGVRHEDDGDFACRNAWSKGERDLVEWALREAQEEIEDVVGYYLAPSWTVGERHDYADPLLLRRGQAIAGGVVSDTVLQAGAAVDYGADPATVTVPAGDCEEADLRVCHAGTETQIAPSSLAVAAGVATIRIPWCRLVDPDYADNPRDGWDYADHATWAAATVDVRCRTNDASEQATLIWRHDCSLACAQRGCSDHTGTACLYVRDEELGIADVTRATYADGAWTATALCSGICACGPPDWVKVSYYSGLATLTRQAEDAIIRLAHAKMPEEPCGCDVTQRLWKRDRNVPEMLTRERINCPFGLSDGAWWAWKQAGRMKLWRAGVL